MRILIVEDEVISAHYLKKILVIAGYDVIGMVTKGADAIELAKEEKPDLIFMDIMLKDHISGSEAAKEIYYSAPNISIIFLTAYSDKEMVEFAVESDAFAYLLKPYRDKEILAMLELAKAKMCTKDIKPIQEIQADSFEIELIDGYIYNAQLNRLFLDNNEVHLGAKALQLIQLLCTNKHITLEINMIIDEIWDTPKSGQTLRSLIHRVREATTQDLILNMNKFGYRIGLKE